MSKNCEMKNLIINWNDQVIIQPNALGWKIWEDYWNKFKVKPPKHQETLTLQLWDVANVFGSYLYNGCEMPFVNTTIEIIKKI